jgi:hypothetical protein
MVRCEVRRLRPAGVSRGNAYVSVWEWAYSERKINPVNRMNNPLYEIFTTNYGIGVSKVSFNAMETKTAILPIRAINCENCY